MSESGGHRFPTAYVVMWVIKGLALLVVLVGIGSAVYEYSHTPLLSRRHRLEVAGATVLGSIVAGAFISAVAYILQVLLAIYDEVRLRPTGPWVVPPVPARVAPTGPAAGPTPPPGSSYRSEPKHRRQGP